MKRTEIIKKSKAISYEDEKFMEKALILARRTLELGNFPVGCVIEYGGKVISDGVRTSTIGKNANEINHAEINALKKLSFLGDSYDRSRMSLYCTLEPCLMCFGAILISGISRIIFAYEDVMGGGTGCDSLNLPSLYRASLVDILSGVLREDSLLLFKLFFKNPNNTYWADSKLSQYTLKQ